MLIGSWQWPNFKSINLLSFVEILSTTDVMICLNIGSCIIVAAISAIDI